MLHSSAIHPIGITDILELQEVQKILEKAFCPARDGHLPFEIVGEAPDIPGGLDPPQETRSVP
jgi:hypothetical protein